ncbi:MAG: hypothetical protein ACYS9X_27885 [Planctomycetota bacterium]|jgi:hypothetical protein
MDAQKLSVGGLVVALIALALAIAAFVSGGGGSEEAMDGIKKAEGELASLNNDLAGIETSLAKIKSARGDSLASVQELSAKVDRLSGETARLGRAVTEAAEKRSAAPAAGGEIDPAKLRELVGAEIRASFERMRAGRGQPGGGQPAGGQQQRGGPPRVDLAKVPQVAKDAAVKAVQGFRVEHAHPSDKTADGKDTFLVDGNANGRSYRIKVTADGKVLESEARQRRGRRPGGNQGGNRPPPRPAEGAGDRF